MTDDIADEEFSGDRVITIDGIEYPVTEEMIENRKNLTEKIKYFEEHPERIPRNL